MKLLYLLLIALAAYSALFFFSDAAISPDDLIFDFFSSHLAETGRLGWLPPGDGIFGEEGFIPRYFVYGQGGLVFPRKFPGFIIFWAGLKKLLPPAASRLVNPLCAVLSLLLIYLIGREVFPGGKTPLRAAVFLAATPVFIRRAFAYNPTLFNLAVFLAALYFLLRALRRGWWWEYLLFGLLAGALLWIRPTNGVYLATFLIFFLIERRRTDGRYLIAALVVIALAGLGLLFFNRSVYGGWFNLGYTATHLQAARAVEESAPAGLRGILGYLSFHPRIWLLHLKNTPAALALGFPLAVLALLGFILPRPRPVLPDGGEEAAGYEPAAPLKFSLYYFWLLVIAIVFFANFGTYGHEENEFTIHSSYLRYLMPVICLLPLFAARALERVKLPAGKMISGLTVFSLLVALLGPAGMIETALQSRYYREAGNFLLSATDERTVVFTHYWDKTVFPERTVYTLGTHFPPGTVGETIRKVQRSGYRVAYPAHPADGIIGDFIRENYQVEEIVGPVRLSLFGGLAARFIPPELYPVRLYLVRGEKRAEEAGHLPPLP